jgi:hypothetical protein
MLKKTEIIKLQKFLNLDTEKKTEKLLVRTVGFLKKNDVTEQALLRILNIIFMDFKHQNNDENIIEQENKKINYDGVKNAVILKHGKKILELKFNNGYGVRRIANFLLQNHKAKVAPSTINNFIKLQNKGE